MKPFVVNSHGRLVFPSNFFPELDFSVLETLEQFDAMISARLRGEGADRAPTSSSGCESGVYPTRFELLRDVALNLLWVNRYAITMYEKRPTRWRDVPRRRDDLFLPVLTPWEDARAQDRRGRGAPSVPCRPSWDADGRGRDLPACSSTCSATAGTTPPSCPPIKPTVAEIACPARRADLPPAGLRPRLPGLQLPSEILDCSRGRARARGAACGWRWCCTTSTPGTARRRGCTPVGELARRRLRGPLPPAQPRGRASSSGGSGAAAAAAPRDARPAASRASAGRARIPPVGVRASGSRCMPRLESLAVVRASTSAPTTTSIRNAAYNWSPMTRRGDPRQDRHRGSAATRSCELERDRAAGRRGRAGQGRPRGPRRSAPSSVCSCTSTRLIPSIATWLSGQLGHASRPTPPSTWWRPAPGFPTGWPRRRACSRRSSGRSCWSAPRSSPTRSARSAPSRMIFGDGAARDGDRRRPATARTGRRGAADLRQRAGERGELHHLAQPRVRQQHHGLRPGGASRSPAATSCR